jgi:hemerythrin
MPTLRGDGRSPARRGLDYCDGSTQRRARCSTEVRRSSTARRSIAFEMLSDAVTHHWALEEQHLYPVLQALGYPDVYSSLEQHRALCHIVHDLRGLCDDTTQFLAALKVLAAHVEQHIVDEDRGVLRFLEAELDERDCKQLGERMAETLAEIENDDCSGRRRRGGMCRRRKQIGWTLQSGGRACGVVGGRYVVFRGGRGRRSDGRPRTGHTTTGDGQSSLFGSLALVTPETLSCRRRGGPSGTRAGC